MGIVVIPDCEYSLKWEYIKHLAQYLAFNNFNIRLDIEFYLSGHCVDFRASSRVKNRILDS